MSADTESSKSSRRPRPEVHIYRPGSGPLRKSCSNVENIKPTDTEQFINNTSPDTSSAHGDVSMSQQENSSDQKKKLGDACDSSKSKNSPSRKQEKTSNQRSQPRDSGKRSGSKKASVNNDKSNMRQNSPTMKTETDAPRDLREKLLEKQHQKTHVDNGVKQDRNIDTSPVDKDGTSNFSHDKVKNGHSDRKSVKRRNARSRLDSTRSEEHSSTTSGGLFVQDPKEISKDEKHHYKKDVAISERKITRDKKDGMIKS